MSPTQDLQQKVCQKFGWSLVYSKADKNNEGASGTDDSSPSSGYCWRADIVTGLGSDQTKTFVTSEPFKDEKEGKAAVSALAMEGLASEVAAWEALPAQELMQVYESTISSMELLDSYNRNSSWLRFWKDPPKVVGIDTEGNQIAPPVLVQIATEDYVILETPRKIISKDLERLLQDDSIVKVFCDNFAHKDKKSLGLPIEEETPQRYTLPPIVDLESLASKYLGPVKVARGLGKIVALTMAEPRVRIEKPKVAKGAMKGRFSNISRFAMIEQGKAKPLRGLFDLKPQEQQYAALDAWCTLQVYQRIQEHFSDA